MGKRSVYEKIVMENLTKNADGNKEHFRMNFDMNLHLEDGFKLEFTTYEDKIMKQGASEIGSCIEYLIISVVVVVVAVAVVINLYSASCSASNALIVPTALRKDEFSARI